MKRKLLLLTLLSIFVLGMILTPVTASHTIKVGKYKAKISDKNYNYLKKVQKAHNKGYNHYEYFRIKTNKYYTFKKPIYKTVKVPTSYKWIYENVLDSETIDQTKNNNYTVKDYNAYSKYLNDDWTWYGSYTKTYKYNWGERTEYWDKFKKKVPASYTTKKVKKGYKKIKDRVYINICVRDGSFGLSKGTYAEVWCYKYADIYGKAVKSKRIKL